MRIGNKLSIFKVIIVISLGLISQSFHAQVGPTLGVGLEQLTMNKGTIDVKVLTEIIMEKQKELKEEALKRFLFRLFPDNSYATKHYLQNAIHILLNEKNPHVIEKEILELTTNYAVALGVAFAYKKETVNGSLKFNASNETINVLLRDVDLLINQHKKDVYPKGLDFNLLVDIVALSLSESQEIKKKGFYKYKINYKEVELYNQLTAGKADIKTKLEELGQAITKEVNTYVINFDIIKEYFFKYKNTSSGDIIKVLEAEYLNQINMIAAQGSSIESIIESLKLDTNASIAFKNYFDANKVLMDKNATNELANRTYLEIESTVTTYSKYLGFVKKSEEAETSLKKQNYLKSDQTYTDVKNIPTDTIKTAKTLVDINILLEKDALKILLDKKGNTIWENITSLKIDDALIKNNPRQKQNLPLDSVKLKQLQQLVKDKITIPDSISAMNKRQKDLANKVFSDSTFLEKYLKNQLALIATATKSSYALGEITNETQLKIIKEQSQNLASIYQQLHLLSQKNTITISDIKNIEDNIIPKLMEISFLKNDNTDKNLKQLQLNFNILTNVLKLNQMNKLKDNDGNNLSFNPKIVDVLTFLSNLDRLDKAATYQSIINLVRDLNEEVIASFDNIDKPKAITKDELGKVLSKNETKSERDERLQIAEAKRIYLLFINAIKKYTLINTEEQYVNIDVVSFLNDLQQYYVRNEKSWFSLYFTLGLNQNFLFNERILTAGEAPIQNIGFASEKLGVKMRLFSLKSHKTTNKALQDDLYLNKKNPFVNEMYGIIYGSGLLYSLANSATNENFDFPHVGVGVGCRFYNALDVNLILGLPFIDGEPLHIKNSFYGIGLDIPLAEYLEKIAKK